MFTARYSAIDPAARQLVRQREAASTLLDCERSFQRAKSNAVADVLKAQGTFAAWRHYPTGDVYDPETHAQYYYHSHGSDADDAGQATEAPAEHGHFHLFLRPAGMPRGVRPADVDTAIGTVDEADGASHLIAIAMDPRGRPVRLFTTNRWVTGETWYSAADVSRMVPYFAVRHSYPSWPANQWLTALVRVFEPEILVLLAARDRQVQTLAGTAALDTVLDDEDVDVLSELRVDLSVHLASVEARWAAAGMTSGPSNLGSSAVHRTR